MAALFEDRHADARMRRTIPHYARLGAGYVAVTAPFMADDTAGRLGLVALVVVALLTAQVLLWRQLIDRLPRWAVFCTLVMYCGLIAIAATIAGDVSSPYRVLHLLPVSFTAAFFTGRVRYAMAIVANLADLSILGTVHDLSVLDTIARTGAFLLIASFAGDVSDTLREALRSNRALHSVLEATSSDLFGDELAEIGLDAALSVAQWDAGAVVLIEADVLEVAAYRGMSPESAGQYTAAQRRADEGVAATVIEKGGLVHIPDLEAQYPDGHVLLDEGMRSGAVLPIRHSTEIIGLLVVCHRTVRHLTDREQDRLEKVAEQLGLALGNARAYRREAEVAERLRELNRRKDEFLANISHELRTPAAAIRLVASTLSRSNDRLRDDQRNEMLDTLDRRSTHLCELIDSLLDEVVAEAGATRLALSEVELRDALARWADLTQLQTGRKITLRLPAAPVVASIDVVKMERVVTNLLSNAAKFSTPADEVELGLDADDDCVRITVTDRGVGISEQALPHIFDRFYQADGGATRSVGGFGIGLSLVHHFVEAHGGTIAVNSVVGEGSTFTVTLPRRAERETPQPWQRAADEVSRPV
jgi:signal transduction histidine kinase